MEQWLALRVVMIFDNSKEDLEKHKHSSLLEMTIGLVVLSHLDVSNHLRKAVLILVLNEDLRKHLD